MHTATWDDVWGFFGQECRRQYVERAKFLGQRKGQAFMNALEECGFTRYFYMLNGSPVDPWESNDSEAILVAMAYILEREE